jgi:hypothetical protein
LQKVGRDVLGRCCGRDKEENKEAGNASGKTLNLCVAHSDFWWLLLCRIDMAPERQYSTLSFKALMEASVVFDAPN